MSIVLIGVSTPGVVDTWRSLWPANELRRRGHDAYYIGHGGESANRGWMHHDTYIVHATNQDVGLTGTVRELRRLARSVWVQFDDDYTQLGLIQDTADRELMGLRLAGVPIGNLREWFGNLTDDHRTALAIADGLIAATEEVADAYREWATGPVYVLHNWIPEWVTNQRLRRESPPVAGWFGGLGAHRRDIEWLGAHARSIERFGVVGDPDGVAGITGAELVIARPWQRWTRLYRELGRFTVGVVPVVDDAFNRPKSWIKPLEFAAMGVQSVAAPLPAYDRLHELGLPVALAETPEAMAGLANDMLAGDRIDAERLRGIVRRGFTMETAGGDEWEKWAADAEAT